MCRRKEAGREPEAREGRKEECEEDETESCFLLRRQLEFARDSASCWGRWEGGDGIVDNHRREEEERETGFRLRDPDPHTLFQCFSGGVRTVNARSIAAEVKFSECRRLRNRLASCPCSKLKGGALT
jgi:hypothetical protein